MKIIDSPINVGSLAVQSCEVPVSRLLVKLATKGTPQPVEEFLSHLSASSISVYVKDNQGNRTNMYLRASIAELAEYDAFEEGTMSIISGEGSTPAAPNVQAISFTIPLTGSDAAYHLGVDEKFEVDFNFAGVLASAAYEITLFGIESQYRTGTHLELQELNLENNLGRKTFSLAGLKDLIFPSFDNVDYIRINYTNGNSTQYSPEEIKYLQNLSNDFSYRVDGRTLADFAPQMFLVNVSDAQQMEIVLTNKTGLKFGAIKHVINDDKEDKAEVKNATLVPA